MTVEDIGAWWAEGRRLPIGGFDLFVHEAGSGPTVTLLHGYPSSSHDWADVVGALGGGVRTVAPDLLGFGASSKPRGHAWSVHGQADLVEQLWEQLGVGETLLVAHDYGSTVAQELLARGAPLTGVVLCNGAVYPHLHRPTDTQQLLRGPQGAELAAAIDGNLFAAALRETFGTAAPATDAQLADMWAGVSRDGGSLLAGELLHYMDDRAEHADRWVGAMENTLLPLTFVWGEQDPVSGAHVLAEVRRRLPRATVRALPEVGHWPPLEAPGEVAAAVRAAVTPL